MLVLSFLLVFSSFQHASIVIAEGIDVLQDEQQIEIEDEVSNTDNENSELETEEKDLIEEPLEEAEEHEGIESDELVDVEESGNEPLAEAEEKEQEEAEEKVIEETEEETEDSLPLTTFDAQGSVEILENIITNVDLKHRNENNEFVELPNPMPHPAEEVLDLAILFEWELADHSTDMNHGYSAGATFTFQLPEEFVVYNDVDGELLTENLGSVGTYLLETDGTVTMTFNENIETRFGVRGTLEFFTVISQDLTGDLEQTINFVIRDQEIGSFPISFESNVETSVEKNGVTDRSYNAQTITWNVDFNKSLDTIENAVLRDQLEEGQIFDVNHPYRLVELKVDLAGNVTEGDVVDPSLYSFDRAEDGFKLAFENEINSAYRLEFRTIITDDVKEQFNNTATLDGDNIGEIPASSSVSTNVGTH